MKILILGGQARYEKYMPRLPFIRQQELVFLDKSTDEETILAVAGDADMLFVDAITPVKSSLIRNMHNLKLIHSETWLPPERGASGCATTRAATPAP